MAGMWAPVWQADGGLDLPHATTHLFARTGHMPQIERAEQFADVVDTFWADQGGDR